MNKSKIDNVKLEQQPNSNSNVDASSVSPTCTKPLVVCSQSRVSKLSDMKKIWLSDEYLKKRKQSYDEIFKTLVEGSPLP